ncbi:MAG: hypothetical protein U9Q07_02335 [Planctomycetota bacterium]|nr:hypothetical protein [Planctomycetota bacterium]
MMKKMKSGFRGDFEAIASDIYGALDNNYRNALALGMLPAPLMQLAETSFREKLAIDEIRRYEIPENTETLKKFAAAIQPEVIREFNRALALAMLTEAKRRGALVV